ncbi:MAG: PEP-CTERM sorting domain-containing protein [Novosphingobium sp.]
MGRTARNLAIAIGALLAAATPAWAGGSTPIPEPTDITLLAMGLAGLIIGRRAAKKPPKD